jgi:hypothetical protein
MKTVGKRADCQRKPGLLLVMLITLVTLWEPYQVAKGEEIRIVISGQVPAGVDPTGVFGLGQPLSLGGERFTLKFAVESTKGTGTVPLTYGSSIVGSSIASTLVPTTGAGSNPITCDFTIRGHTFTFGKLPCDTLQARIARLLVGGSQMDFFYNDTFNVPNTRGGSQLTVVVPFPLSALPLLPLEPNYLWSSPLYYLPLGLGDGAFTIDHQVFAPGTFTKRIVDQEAYGQLSVFAISVRVLLPLAVKAEAAALAAYFRQMENTLQDGSIVLDGAKYVVRNLAILAAERGLEHLIPDSALPVNVWELLSSGALLLARDNPAGASIVAVSAVAGLLALVAEAVADDPPDKNYKTVATPQKLTYPLTHNAAVDKAIEDYLQLASLLIASLHAEERWQGATLAGDSASAAVQANAFQLYWQQATDLKGLLGHDNVQLKALLPRLSINGFPGGATAIATAFNHQCGQPIEASLNKMLLVDGYSQTTINEAVCAACESVRPIDISVDFASALAIPLP